MNVQNMQKQAAYKERFQYEMGIEMNETYIMFDDEMREWYRYAMLCLSYSGPLDMNIQQEGYLRLREIHEDGVSVINIAYLINNIEKQNPVKLGMTQDEFNKMIEININMAKAWKIAEAPIQERVNRKLNILTPSKLLKIN